MEVTIKKIAEIAGVSRGTVDRALNDRTGVKPEVKEKIKKIAEELGYKPNIAAKALADKRYTKKKIGVLLNSEGNPFFEEVRRGVEASLENLKGFGISSVIRTMKGYDARKQISIINEMVKQKVNGIVLTPINDPEIAEKIDALKEKGIEVVTINTDVLNSQRMAYVGCRYRKSGTVAAGLLGMMSSGEEEKYAIVGNSKKNLAVERRIQGIQETLEEDFPWIKVTDILEGEDSDERCYELVSRLLQEKKNLDGICFAAAGKEGGIRAILDQKRKLKIVTFDITGETRAYLKNDIISATIGQEPYKQGYEGVDILGKYLIRNQKPETELNHTELSIVTKYSI